MDLKKGEIIAGDKFAKVGCRNAWMAASSNAQICQPGLESREFRNFRRAVLEVLIEGKRIEGKVVAEVGDFRGITTELGVVLPANLDSQGLVF